MILVLQHSPLEGPGLVGELADGRCLPLQTARTFAGDDIPAPEDAPSFSGIVTLGGPMSVNDPLPWVEPEKALLDAAMRAGVPVLGICLGAQLMASALGAAVRRGPAPEVGFGEVMLTGEGKGDPLFGSVEEALPVLHWHGETFDLPAEAVLLASSPACRNQAFRFGRSAYGFQFHLEADAEMLSRWIEEECASENGLFRDPEPLAGQRPGWEERVRLQGFLVLARFLDLVRERP